jgi:AraC family transcriptional activator of pobA
MKNHALSHVPFFGTTSLNATPFQLYEIKSKADIFRTCNRRGFYKIFLIIGKNINHFANKEIETESAKLFFGNANITYNLDFIYKEQKGFACILSKKFLQKFDYLNILQQSRLFEANSVQVFLLSNEQEHFITTIFHKLISEQSSNYTFKNELIHTWVSLIMHEALKIKIASDFLSTQALLS